MEPLILTGILIVVLCVKYFKSRSDYCPQCYQRREDDDEPLCTNCGWMFVLPGSNDDDYLGDEEGGR